MTRFHVSVPSPTIPELRSAGYRVLAYREIERDTECEWCGYPGVGEDDDDPAPGIMANDGAILCGWGCARKHYGRTK